MKIPTPGKETLAKLLLAIVIVSVFSGAGFVVGETFLSSFYTTTAPIHHNASDGPEVVQTKDYNLRSGNPFTDKSYNLSTENNGWVNVSTSDPDSSAMVISIDRINGTWTNTSSITATSGNITVNPNDKHQIGVGGQVTSLKFKDVNANDTETDLIYSASGTGTLIVENTTPNTQFGLVDQSTNEGLDVTVSDGSGTAEFTEVPSGTHTVRVEELGQLFIRNETSPHGLVKGSDNIELLFIQDVESDPTIVNRSVSDGEVDLTGLPVDQSFVVTAHVGGYYNRTVLIKDLSQQENLFLANKNTTVRQITFLIIDETGKFPPGDTQFYVEKPINDTVYDSGADGWDWMTIAGDNLGADNEYVDRLIYEDRYRLVVENDEGDRRILGAYTPIEEETVTLRPVPVGINVTDDESYVWNATHTNTSSGGTITFQYVDPDDETTDMTIQIYEQGNESNAFANQTVSGPVGTVSITQTLTAAESEKTWVVEYDATRDGESIGGKTTVGDPINVQIPELDDWVKWALAILFIVLTGAAANSVNKEAMAVSTSFVGGGFWMMGWLPTEAGAAIMIALMGAAAWKMAKGRFG